MKISIVFFYFYAINHEEIVLLMLNKNLKSELYVRLFARAFFAGDTLLILSVLRVQCRNCVNCFLFYFAGAR